MRRIGLAWGAFERLKGRVMGGRRCCGSGKLDTLYIGTRVAYEGGKDGGGITGLRLCNL